MLKEVSPQLTAPVVVFSYYNPLLRRGIDTFCKQIKNAGAAGADCGVFLVLPWYPLICGIIFVCLLGLLVPDIPLEETPEIREVATTHGLELVLLTTPTTPKERMNAIAKDSQGFVYLVSITGAVCDAGATLTALVLSMDRCHGNQG